MQAGDWLIVSSTVQYFGAAAAYAWGKNYPISGLMFFYGCANCCLLVMAIRH